MALSVMALYHTGRHEQAKDIATRLFHITEPEGYVRMYLDIGEPIMKQVLKVILNDSSANSSGVTSDSISRSSVSRWRSTFEQQKTGIAYDILRRSTKLQTLRSEPQLPEVQQQMAEPLSPQEVKVLRLLVAGHTYAEMAQTLIVSVHTIKTQVSNIYRKLGVNRRAEAIVATHHLDLL